MLLNERAVTFLCGTKTVVEADALLFAEFGSDSFAEALAVSVSVPVAEVLTAIATEALEPLANVPRLQVTEPLQVPWLGVEEINVTPEGRESERVTPVAGEGPLFITIIV